MREEILNRWDAPTPAEAERDMYLDEMDARRERGEIVIQCGHCGYPHPSVADVRACAQRDEEFVAEMALEVAMGEVL